VGKASSSKKIARMAQKGKGKKVRFQGGTVFPLTILIVSVLGIALIAYSRTSTQALAIPPQASNSDHWHIAFGIFDCDDWLPNISGAKEGGTTGVPDPEFLASGVHSHDDGVIHYHPYTAAASGYNAKLQRYLDVYDIELSNDKLQMPDDQGGQVFEEGETKCTVEDGDEVDAELRLAVWDDAKNPGDFRILTADMANARIDRNGMAMAIFFAPTDVDIVPPPTASNLDALGAVDTGAAPPTTVAEGTATTVADGSATTVAGSGSTVTTTGEPSATTAAGVTTTSG
jgi:hypothetical protein